MKNAEFENLLASVINKCSMENGSDTPDFILAGFLNGCLVAFDTASRLREEWHNWKLIGEEATNLPSVKALHIAARVWCDQDMKSVVMDTDAAERIAAIIDEVIQDQECGGNRDGQNEAEAAAV